MFLLLLMGLGAANVSAQVRIGGDTAPNAAAVLDLNVNNDATPTGNKGALALPRVSLGSTTAQLNGAIPITGMLVYNTNASMTGGNGVGMYFWDGTAWKTYRQADDLGLLSGLKLFLDTTVTVTMTSNGFQAITAPTVQQWDICLASRASGVSATTGSILFMYYMPTGVTQVRFKCFHLMP